MIQTVSLRARRLASVLSLLLGFAPWSVAQALEKVVLQLRWDHQAQFAGYYAAQWQGYYTEAGFEVDIRSALTPEGKILSAIEEVADGRADFGVGAADILIARDQGIPLVVLAAIFQQSAAEFYVRDSAPMQTLADLPKLRVARNVNDLIDVELQAMLRAEGIDPQNVTPYPHQPGIEHFVTDQVDVMPGYRL
ncbi:MAG: ABC transporter substrate-binding protein, partial [Anaerolineae bacterium]|nr:ABC transporter substrate-binding protein [Anaerolineae bacterium]